MPEFNRTHITATTAEFKDNLSRYTRLLESRAYSAVFVRRYNEVVGVYMHKGAREAYENFENSAKKEGRHPVSSYEDDIFRGS